jgi:hypothetical protein
VRDHDETGLLGFYNATSSEEIDGSNVAVLAQRVAHVHFVCSGSKTDLVVLHPSAQV